MRKRKFILSFFLISGISISFLNSQNVFAQPESSISTVLSNHENQWVWDLLNQIYDLQVNKKHDVLKSIELIANTKSDPTSVYPAFWIRFKDGSNLLAELNFSNTDLTVTRQNALLSNTRFLLETIQEHEFTFKDQLELLRNQIGGVELNAVITSNVDNLFNVTSTMEWKYPTLSLSKN